MKLYLSSMSPPNKEELLKLLPDQEHLNVAIVPNAWDVYPAERKETEVNNCKSMFTDYGFNVRLLDITNTDKEAMGRLLQDTHLVWVMGGNVFYLNYQVHHSGFDEVVEKLIDQGLVYGGESAGAAVVGTSLHGLEHLDDPKLAPELRWTGIGLLDGGFIPHWGWEKYGDDLQKTKNEMAKHSAVTTIDNDKAIVVIDRETRVVQNLLS